MAQSLEADLFTNLFIEYDLTAKGLWIKTVGLISKVCLSANFLAPGECFSVSEFSRQPSELRWRALQVERGYIEPVRRYLQ